MGVDEILNYNRDELEVLEGGKEKEDKKKGRSHTRKDSIKRIGEGYKKKLE